MKPRLLDLFCCAGGAGMGYARAGFEVVGVDIAPQKHYPFEFHQADALEYLAAHGQEFDAIHASPPCQENTRARTLRDSQGKALKDRGGNMIPETRKALDATGLPYVMENVEGSDLANTLLLCGSMFPELRVTDDTGVRWLQRHRLFESNIGGGSMTSSLSKPNRHLLYDRTEGQCPWCGEGMRYDDMHAHHRLLRAQGGTWDLSNIVGTHGWCHDLQPKSIHQEPIRAYALGFMLRSHRVLPAEIPIFDASTRQWYLLTDSGHRYGVLSVEAAELLLIAGNTGT